MVQSRRALLTALSSVLLCHLALSSPAFAIRTDAVVLQNGDRITGEVKQLESGRLRYKTDDAGTIYIEWLNVAELTSTTTYEVETSETLRFVGRLESRGAGIVAVMSDDGGEFVLPHGQVVRIARLDDGYWKRLEGSFDLGFSYTKADNTAQGNVDLDVDQRRPGHHTALSVSGIVTDQDDSDRTNRFDATLAHLRLRRSRWFSQTFVAAQGNDELGLDLRVIAGAGFGRTALQTNRTLLRGSAGLAVKEEWPTVGDSEEEVEAFLAGTYSFFTFDFPNTKIDLQLTVYQGLSSDGGLRAESDVSVRRELAKNFYVSVGAYESYDQDPIASTAAQNDWGMTTSIGWSF